MTRNRLKNGFLTITAPAWCQYSPRPLIYCPCPLSSLPLPTSSDYGLAVCPALFFIARNTSYRVSANSLTVLLKIWQLLYRYIGRFSCREKCFKEVSCTVWLFGCFGELNRAGSNRTRSTSVSRVRGLHNYFITLPYDLNDFQ